MTNGLDLVLDRFNMANSLQATYFNFYVIISIAILTIVGSQWGKPLSSKFHPFMFFAYLVFAIGDCLQFAWLQQTIISSSKAIEKFITANPNVVDSILSPALLNITLTPVPLLCCYNSLFAVIILIFIYLAGKATAKKNKESN